MVSFLCLAARQFMPWASSRAQRQEILIHRQAVGVKVRVPSGSLPEPGPAKMALREGGNGSEDAARADVLEMSFEDAEVRPLMELEGLKQWLPGRVSGYAQLEKAVEKFRFYEPAG